MSFVPKTIHISYDHYEKYKETLEELLDQTIIVSDENAMSIIYENEKNILVTGINNSLLLNCPITDKNVFIIELIP
jgi:hypothetical protein